MLAQLIGAFLTCLVLTFLLAAAEAALGRVSLHAARDLAQEGRRGADRLVTILADSAGYLSTLAFVRISVETTAAVLATLAMGQIFEEVWQILGTSILVMSVASFALVGVSPRTLGRQHAVPVSLLAASYVVWLRRILGPIARLMVTVGNAVTPGRGYRDGPFENEAELRDLVDLAGDNQLIEDEEREMIHSVFELGDTLVREVMVPRTDMLTIETERTLRAATSLFLRSGFSRVPVIGEDADDPVGLLYFKDVAQRTYDVPESVTQAVTEVMRPAAFVPDSKPVAALLREMQRDQTHMAIVVDEYGGTAGLVTIEDLLEEIVGDIADEYDRETPEFEELPDGGYRVDATMHVDDLAELFDMEFEEEDVDTVGGLLAKAIGRVPILGSAGEAHGLALVAERMSGRRHRIATVLVHRVPTHSGAQEDEL
ncbi:MAG: hemolysin family protein [Austwickia sp.]|nr:hemolysin family protein [Actinomycetota bacterium]MCB1253174.1 HlyC/CorC family transporter [Austwickia sp.]MCO5310728.1 hemolysin family protein [Austwickia sp.]